MEALLKEKIRKVIRETSSIAIAGHVRPDGDCVGSCLPYTII